MATPPASLPYTLLPLLRRGVVCCAMALAAVSLAVAPAHARLTKAVFYYGSVAQWLDFQYDFRGGAVDGSDYASSHYAQELYNVGSSFSLLHPDYFTGQASLTLGLSQQVNTGDQNDDSGNGHTIDYQLSGDLWRYRPVSAAFTVQSGQERINQSDTDSYDLFTDLRSISMKWNNRFAPSVLNYFNTNTETSGLSNDRQNERSRLSLQSVFNHRYLGANNVELRREDQTTQFSKGTNDVDVQTDYVSVSNRLKFGSKLRPGWLYSSWNGREDTGTRPLRSSYWRESLSYNPGRALELELEFSRNSLDAETLELDRDDWRAAANHQLFNSLNTYLEGLHTRETGSQGERRYTQGRLTFGYHKQLPGESRLNVTLSRMQGLTEQDFVDDGEVFGREELTVDDPEVQILLAASNIVPGSILVADAESGAPYDENIDYLIFTNGSRTSLYVGDSPLIESGTRLVVEYFYAADSQLKYATTGTDIGMSLGLAGNLNLYAKYSQTDYEFIDGDSEFIPKKSHYYLVGFEKRLPKLSFGGLYSLTDSTTEERQSVEAYVNQTRRVYGGNLYLRAHDTYTMTSTAGREGFDSSESSTNHLSFNVDYRTVLFRRTKAKLYGRFSNVQSDTVDRNEITTGLQLTYSTAKLLLDMNGYVRWRFIDSLTMREDVLYLHLRRFF